MENNIFERALVRLFSWGFGWGVACLAFYSFLSAQENFSYDYKYYIAYFEEIRLMSFYDIFDSIGEGAPYIYVNVQPSGLLEIGFVLLVRVLFEFCEAANLVYALVASASLMLRVFVMRSFGIGWVWVVLVNVYAVTLFESNALRAGLALTIIILAGRGILSGRLILGGGVAFMSVFFHVQAAFVLGFFFLFWMFFDFLWRRNFAFILACFGLLVSGVLVGFVLSLVGFSKFADYNDKYVQSVGLNSISFTGLLLVLAIIIKVASSRRELLGALGREGKVLLSFVVSAVPALSALLFATSLGAIGDRLWQFSFVILAIFMLRINNRFYLGRGSVFLLVLCLLVSIVNVIFRYPLSNFFYPIIPYVDIVPEF